MNTVLSQANVIDIRRSAIQGRKSANIASPYGVSARTVQRIIKGDLWASIPTDRFVKGFNNYEVTIDGRIWSNTKRGYISLESRAGQPAARLRKTLKSGKKVEKTVLVSQLVKSHF